VLVLRKKFPYLSRIRKFLQISLENQKGSVTHKILLAGTCFHGSFCVWNPQITGSRKYQLRVRYPADKKAHDFVSRNGMLLTDGKESPSWHTSKFPATP
jgi:hypothetical protein